MNVPREPEREKKILVGVDGSPNQQHVFAAATELATRLGAKLVLFRAVGLPAELPSNAYMMKPADVTRALEHDARENLAGTAAAVEPGLVDSLHVVVGTPWQAICRAAQEYDVDLILIGSHGYDILDRVVGTTAAKVVNHADRSVFVVRHAPLR